MASRDRTISVAPYRKRDGAIEVLLLKGSGDWGLISGQALTHRTLHQEALSLAESEGRVSGPVQKRPLRRSDAAGEIVIFAVEAVRGAEPDGVHLRWQPLEQALERLPALSRDALSCLPARVRMVARRPLSRRG